MVQDELSPSPVTRAIRRDTDRAAHRVFDELRRNAEKLLPQLTEDRSYTGGIAHPALDAAGNQGVLFADIVLGQCVTAQIIRMDDLIRLYAAMFPAPTATATIWKPGDAQ